MIPRIVTIGAALALLTAVASPADSPPAQSQPAATTCVAIIEPEVLADMPADQRKALAGAIDTLLTESLARQKGFVLVDRQALDKVLQEKALAGGGAAKVNAQDVAEGLRAFWAAGILVCSRVDAKNRSLVVEAVSAQTGQLLATLYAKDAATPQAAAKLLAARSEAFWRDTAEATGRARGKPLLEISGKLTGGLTRLAWMVDDFTDAAGARVDSGGKEIWLVPRQPLFTKEERLLRVMGLAQARPGDVAAGLSPMPQIRLTFELADSAKTGVAFEKTPISLKLSLRRGQDKPAETHIDGEAGQWDACRDKAVQWAISQLSGPAAAATAPAADEAQRARQLAREELAAARQMVADAGNRYDWYSYETEPAVLAQIARRALRAAHLDPTNEEAARYVALTCDALYAPPGENSANTVRLDRVITECQRYLDRFRQTPKPYNPTFQVMMKYGYAGMRASHPLRPNGSARYADKPNDELYRYSKAYVDNIIPVDCAWVAEQGTDNIWAISNTLRHEVFSNCPQDKLEQERDRWREFWKTTVDKIKNASPPPPFQFVEVGYCVRKKDYESVRRLYSELAAKFPKLDSRAWATRIPCTETLWKEQLTLTLRAAGDPQWQTWEPDFSHTKAENSIPFAEMTGFMNSLRPRFPSTEAAGPDPKAPSVAFVVPDAIRKANHKEGSSRPPEEVLLLVDGEAWLSLPGPWVSANRDPSLLYRAKLDKRDGDTIRLSPELLAWPARPDGAELPGGRCTIYCHLVESAEGGSRVWIGTDRGLARFDHAQDGSWKGRWYTTRDGLPRDIVASIGRARQGKEDVLLVTAPGDNNTHIFTLNPRNDRCVMLFDGRRQDVRLWYHFTAKLRDGRLALVNLLQQGVYGDIDLDDIVEFSAEATYGHIAAVRDGTTGKPSIWQGLWDGPERMNYLTELPLSGVKPQRQAFRSQRITVFPFEAARDLFGDIIFLDDPSGSLSTTPYFYTTYIVGVDDTLWIAAASGASPDNSLQIYGFRPGTGRGRTTTIPATKPAAAGDLWIGPFATPDGTPVTNLESPGKGQLLVTTRRQSYLISTSELMEAAAKAGRVTDPDLMASAAFQRLDAAGWQAKVPAMILRQQWANALIALDNHEREIASGAANKDENVQLALWRAHVLARMPNGLEKSIEQYRTVAENSTSPRCAKVFARMNQVFLLHKAGHYAEMLTLVEQVAREFPQVAPGRPASSLGWYVADARKRMAASQPASRPTSSSTRTAIAQAR